jgi:hypothetical protein
MMKPRTQLLIAIGLFILGIALYTLLNSFTNSLTRDRPSGQAFPATIQRDCAPWDGGAFTVHVPINAGTSIDISIWQSPDIRLPKTFSFPDDTGQVGNASLIHSVGLPEQLSGSVSFSGVDQSAVVNGKFDLRDAMGTQYKGTFKAQWDDQILLCG